MPHVVSDGLKIRYVVDGTGDATVLLLHGAGAGYAMWERTGWPEVLTEAGYRVVGIDARGCGESDIVTEPRQLSCPYFVSDVSAVLDDCGVDRAHVFGYSMGAGQTLRLGIERPDRVRSMVLGGLGGIALANSGHYLTTAAHARERLVRSREMLTRQPLRRDYFELYFEALARDPLTEPAFESIATPTVVVVGEGDTAQGEFAAFEVTKMLERRIPGSRRVVVDGVDHMTCIGDERCKKAVLEFLEGLA